MRVPPARPRVHYRRANGSVVISSDSLIRHGFSCDDRAVLAEVCCSDAYRGGVVVGREGGGGIRTCTMGSLLLTLT